MIKEWPILFSGPMVQAILAGAKTQTRRALYVPGKFERGTEDRRYPPSYGNGEWPDLPPGKAWTLSKWSKAQPGDRVWVREAWRVEGQHTDAYSPSCIEGNRAHFGRIDYEASITWNKSLYGKLRPSIHMPRTLSRITLELTDVRVERLQAISEADALAEGIVRLPDDGYGLPDGSHYHHTDPRISYWSLWDAINEQGATEANPWIVAMTFKRVDGHPDA